MNCEQFEELVHDLDRPGTAGFGLREVVLAHAESCSRCGQLLTRSESLDLALRALSRKESERQASVDLERFLREKFRQQSVRLKRSGPRWQPIALAAAAVLLLGLGSALHYRAEHLASPQIMDLQRPANDGTAWEEAARDDAALSSDSATDFVPLPYADDSMAGENGAIVRVVLSRSALASLGMPVTDMGSADRIPADIIVSEDGAPQAIRLVAQSEVDQ